MLSSSEPSKGLLSAHTAFQFPSFFLLRLFLCSFLGLLSWFLSSSVWTRFSLQGSSENFSTLFYLSVCLCFWLCTMLSSPAVILQPYGLPVYPQTSCYPSLMQVTPKHSLSQLVSHFTVYHVSLPLSHSPFPPLYVLLYFLMFLSYSSLWIGLARSIVSLPFCLSLFGFFCLSISPALLLYICPSLSPSLTLMCLNFILSLHDVILNLCDILCPLEDVSPVDCVRNKMHCVILLQKNNQLLGGVMQPDAKLVRRWFIPLTPQQPDNENN